MGRGRSKMLMEKALRAKFLQDGQERQFSYCWIWAESPLDGLYRQSGARCAAWATHKHAAGGIFRLADEAPYTMNEIIETVGKVLHEDFGIRADLTSSDRREPKSLPLSMRRFSMLASIARTSMSFRK
jgi:hypothetical protein